MKKRATNILHDTATDGRGEVKISSKIIVIKKTDYMRQRFNF
jgi:hypothetical protein